MEQQLLILLLLVTAFAAPCRAEPTRDRAALLDFVSAAPYGHRLRWNNSTSVCDWVGVTCDAHRTAVIALHLPGADLLGSIPLGTLGRLTALRVLSLHSNRLSGSIPADLANLTLLRALYLYDNLFSGVIPAGLAQLDHLARLDLSRNELTGEIPFGLDNLTRLTSLFLQNNRLSGSLPSISIASLVDFNVSSNELNGTIPKSLERFPASSFAGNPDLCGGPLPPCSPSLPSPSPASEQEPEKKSSKKLSPEAIIGLAVAGGAVLLPLLLVLCYAFLRRRRQGGGDKVLPRGASRSGDTETTSSSTKDEKNARGAPRGAARERKKNRLVFMGDGGYCFDLEDLLRASAEVLGKGSAGTSYKAVLEEGTTVVVKRLKDVTASKREFEAHMESVVGKVEHENLLPVRAYYYSEVEMLLVFDYLPAGSLSSFLHGARGAGRSPLDWESRMRAAIAAGRGLAHLHTVAQVVHGNVKASNVILRSDLDSCVLSDFCLHPLFSNKAPPNRVAGYRAPEVLATRRPTYKSDVYSFGVLLLELLTGRSPNQAYSGDVNGIDLPRWVRSVVREEWTAEVFDAELMPYADIEEEMVRLLQIAMACVAVAPDARPQLPEVVRMLEEIVNRAESNVEAPRSSSDDPSKVGNSGGGLVVDFAGPEPNCFVER